MVTQQLDPPTIAPPPPRRRLSWVRILVVILVVAGAVYWVWTDVRRSNDAAASAQPQSSFTPYVDVTATPVYAFENPTGTTAGNAVLGFIVSAKNAPCEPSWGMAYSLAAAADSLDLDRRVARVGQLGGTVTASFGGAANSEMSIGCTDVKSLTAAYKSVIDRYSVTTVDLDIEGAAASTPAVSARRGQAIAALATAQAAAGHPVKVWLTLPVGPAGLSSDGLTVLSAMLAAHVDLAGINGMTMDYGVDLAGRSMSAEGELALNALHAQVKSAYRSTGTDLTDGQAWQHIGATAMIGQNDIPGEVFGLADARALVAFAQLHQLPRLSMWSANRDQGCGPNYPNTQVVSDACSGVTQDAGDFAAVFNGVAPALATSGSSAASTVTSSIAAATAITGMTDNPATSPYAIWNVKLAYLKNTKIVWHHNVYQAKWYTLGDVPDAPVAAASDTPWTLLGPVLPGETPAPTPTLAAGTYPQWSSTSVYVAGTKVMVGTIGYQAKWWTQGDTPGVLPDGSTDSSPWELITEAAK